MTKYPIDIDRETAQQFKDDADAVITWSVDDEHLPGDQHQAMSSIPAELLKIDHEPGRDGHGADTQIHVRLSGPVDHVPADPDQRDRLYEVAQALADGKDVTIEGEEGGDA